MSITELAVPEDTLLDDAPRQQASDVSFSSFLCRHHLILRKDTLSKEDGQVPSKACSTFDSWAQSEHASCRFSLRL